MKKVKKEIIINENRDFKGVWVPNRLYLTTEFTPNEKFVLIEIHSLTNSGSGKCFASNKHFADFVGLKENTIQKMMSKFEKSGYIKRVFEYKRNSKEIERRIIKLTNKFYDSFVNESEEPCLEEKGCNCQVYGFNSTEGYGKKSIGVVEKNPEISNTYIKYNNNLSNTSNKASTVVEDNYKAFFSEKEKKILELPSLPYEYSQEEFDKFIYVKLYNIILQIPGVNSEDLEKAGDITEIISYFHKRYLRHTGERHPIMKDSVYESIIRKMLMPIDAIIDLDVVMNMDAYKKMIDRFFSTEYGKKSGNITDCRMGYFFSDTVLERLCYRECQ